MQPLWEYFVTLWKFWTLLFLQLLSILINIIPYYYVKCYNKHTQQTISQTLEIYNTNSFDKEFAQVEDIHQPWN